MAAVEGEEHLERITAKNAATGETETVPAHSLFIFIGAAPKTDWLDGVVERDERGFILSGPDLMQDGKRPKGWRPDRDPFLLETSVPGIFVAGDVRARFGQALRLGGRRGFHRRAVRPPVHEGGLR